MTTPLIAPTVITCHRNADWDALSSMIGMTALYPEGIMIFPGSMEKTLTLFFTETASHLYSFHSLKELDLNAVQRLIIVDTQSRSRVKHVEELLSRPGIEIHIWDHHPTPADTPAGAEDTIPASIQKIREVGSTCTLICEALRAQRLFPTCQEATLLGLGIYSDTGSFSYHSTTPADLTAAAWLRHHGMDIALIADLVHTGMTSQHIRILNRLLESASVQEVGPHKIMLTEISLDSFLEDFAYLAQKFMEMESCQVLFALANMEDKVQIVARSRTEDVDVGAVCTFFGGGGHSYAASASVKNKTLPEVKDQIFQQIYTQIHPDRRARDLMSSPVIGLDAGQTLQDAERRMTRYGLKAAPVFKPGTRHCVGYLEGQTAAKAVTHGLGTMPVSEYMNRTVLTVAPDTTLQRLMDIIVGARQRLVPVVDKNETIGVVTRTDIISLFTDEQASAALAQSSHKRERNLSRLLAAQVPSAMLTLLQRTGALGDTLSTKVYVVGGFVRDILLQRAATAYDDIDLVVEGDGIAFAKALALELGGRVREHRAFMTALVLYPDQNGKEQRIDVATARLEYYQYPAALPTVELSSLKMDLFRRDFTINAMALRLNTPQFGLIVDFFGGQDDIRRKTIRVIHALSFVEDPTRIIRAVRFEKRYGFQISSQGEKLIRNALNLNLVDKLSGSRVLHELALILREEAPEESLLRLDQLGVLAAIYPELALTPDRIRLLRKLRDVLDWYRLLYVHPTPDLTLLYLFALSSGMSTDHVETLCQRLGLEKSRLTLLATLRNKLRLTLQELSFLHNASDTPRVSRICTLLKPLPLEALLYLMARAPEELTSRSVSQYIYHWKNIHLDITGDDLKNMGIAPGPRLGSLMRLVLAAKQDGLAPDRNEQLLFVQNLLARIEP